MTPRISWIDTLRGLGIIFVIIIHSTGNDSFRSFLMSFTIPIMFFISGFILNKERFTAATLFLNRLKSRMVPYVSWVFLFYLIALADRIISGHDYSLYASKLLQLDFAVGFLSGDFAWLRDTIHNGPLWFLPCLFLVEICFFFCARLSSMILFIALIVFSCGAQFLFTMNDWHVPYVTNLGSIFLLYYGTGFILRKAWDRNSLSKVTQMKPAAGIFLAVVLVGLTGWAVAMIAPLGSKFTLELFFYRTIIAFSGISAFSILSLYIQDWRWLRYLGRNTFIIFILYEPLRQLSLRLFKLISFNFFNNLFVDYRELFTLLQIATVLILSIPAILLINGAFPFLIGKQNKKHGSLGEISIS